MSLNNRHDDVETPVQQPAAEAPAQDNLADVRYARLDQIDRAAANEPRYLSKAIGTSPDAQIAFLDMTPIFRNGLQLAEAQVGADRQPKKSADGSITYKREDGTSLKEKPDGSKLEINAQNKVTQITYADGTNRQFTWEGNELVATTTRDGKVFDRVKRADRYVDEWTQKGTTQPWKGALTVDTNGDYTYKSSGGVDKGTTVVAKTDETKRISRPDGTETFANEKENYKVDYDRNRQATQITYADGKVRTFTYKGGEVQAVEIKEPGENGAVNRWDRIGKDKFKSNTGTEWNVKFEVKGDKYTVTDLDSDNKKTTRMPSGRMVEEFPKENRKVETFKGQITSVTVDGKEVSLDRDKSGKVSQIANKPGGELLKKNEDGSWSAFDKTGNKKIDDGLQRIGDPVITDKGAVTFLSADGGLIKQVSGVVPEKIRNDQPIEREIIGNKHLDDQAKIRFLENINTIQKSSTISDTEKAAFYKETTRLLEEKADAPFTAKERAQMAEQLAWHVANPTEDSQGRHPTCSVTDIRLCLTRERPSEFARMIADVGNTGKFVSRDGSTIEPRKDSLHPGKEESIFPPAAATRTWVGKISDVTMANIHWQRRVTDINGHQVAKGSMKYDEVTPTDRDDSGSRVHRYDLRQGTWWRTEQAKRPNLHAVQIMDIYKQITGKEEEGRFIVNADHKQTGQGLAVVGSKDDLHNALMKGPWPKIIEVQNNILQGKQPDGKDHEHVVIATGYDPKTGKVMIDNSHNPSDDMLEKDKQVSIDTLYQATKLKQAVQTVNQHHGQQQQRQQLTFHYGNQHGYYQNQGYRSGGRRYR